MYVSMDDNPAYGERKSREQLQQDNGYELCDLPEPVYDNCYSTMNVCMVSELDIRDDVYFCLQVHNNQGWIQEGGDSGGAHPPFSF